MKKAELFKRKKSPVGHRRSTGSGTTVAADSAQLSSSASRSLSRGQSDSTPGGAVGIRPRAASSASSSTGENLDSAALVAEDSLSEHPDMTVHGVYTPDGSEVMMDDTDIVDSNTVKTPVDPVRARLEIEKINLKIQKIKEKIKSEQNSLDESVNEYLKLTESAEGQEKSKLKQMFESKNHKSQQSIQSLQKKLEGYKSHIRCLQAGEWPTHRHPIGVIKDMGQGIKDVGANIKTGITGFSGTVMAKPREFAHLIKNKFGSADNINSLVIDEPSSGGSVESAGTGGRVPMLNESSSGSRPTNQGSATFPRTDPQQIISGKGGNKAYTEELAKVGAQHRSATFPRLEAIFQPPGVNRFQSEDECSSIASKSSGINNGLTCSPNKSQLNVLPLQAQPGSPELPMALLETIMHDFEVQKQKMTDLQDACEHLKNQNSEQMTLVSQALQDERERCDRLEWQMNDLTELHQNEILNLKQEVTSMEEKMEYQMEERARDMQEGIENCQTRIGKIELQQQHQQLVTLEGFESSQARTLIFKLINVLLAVLQVILVLISTVANVLTPLLRTRIRILTTAILVFVMALIWQQWPRIIDIVTEFQRRRLMKVA
ncbi:PREDICTED: transmembrane and coiled-coil domains protein 1-like isoform X2 [Priapulus caudatus]|uniref:Transmembrane and coiled-coil domains protein 1-like isoform X2 n=1 Tax=Priapulus caudatus TaxID=37621 RepID=A0ABM1EXQ7_PRICU|nr:PREDICTED: transmembrane and coiled-coil domains protein 1-like isoform X2 [Priapulus caudatus]